MEDLLLIMRMRSPAKRFGHWGVSAGMDFDSSQVPTTWQVAETMELHASTSSA
jgi:hypothetical protein